MKTGQRYLGETYTDKTKNGTNNYRKDGSVMFGSQADGVAYMTWATFKDGDSGGKQKEQFAFLDGNTMLVTPDKFNEASESNPYSAGYKISDGTFFDPVEQRSKGFDATVHTHPAEKNHGNRPSGGDVIAAELYPSKVGFVLGLGNDRVYGFNHKGQFDTSLKVTDFKKGKKFPKYGR